LKLASYLCGLIVAASLLMGVQVHAEEKFPVPVQKLVGTDGVVDFGEQVDLRLSSPENPPKTLASTSVNWTVLELYVENGQPNLREKRVRLDQDGMGFTCGAGIKEKKLYVIAHVVYLFVDKTGDKVEYCTKDIAYRTEIQIGKKPEPGPGPGPDPGPTPPKPDAIQAAVNAAFASETDAEKALLPKLIDRYKSAVSMVDQKKAATWGELWTAIADEAAKTKLAGHLHNTQVVISTELEKTLPVNPKQFPNQPITEAHAKLLVEQFSRMQKVLEAIK